MKELWKKQGINTTDSNHDLDPISPDSVLF